jgi:hypothetical protein
MAHLQLILIDCNIRPIAVAIIVTNFAGESSRIWESLKNLTIFYGIQSFITVFTWARHLSLSWARLIQSMPPHPISLRSTLGPSPPTSMSSLLSLSFWLYHRNPVCILLPSHSTRPANLIL